MYYNPSTNSFKPIQEIAAIYGTPRTEEACNTLGWFKYISKDYEQPFFDNCGMIKQDNKYYAVYEPTKYCLNVLRQAAIEHELVRALSFQVAHLSKSLNIDLTTLTYENEEQGN